MLHIIVSNIAKKRKKYQSMVRLNPMGNLSKYICGCFKKYGNLLFCKSSGTDSKRNEFRCKDIKIIKFFFPENSIDSSSAYM